MAGFGYSREWWCELRSSLDRRHVAGKDSQGAVLALAETYGQIPAGQRSEVNAVLLEWVLSDEEGLRFDALAIVDDCGITEAIPPCGRSRTGWRQSRGQALHTSGPRSIASSEGSRRPVPD